VLIDKLRNNIIFFKPGFKFYSSNNFSEKHELDQIFTGEKISVYTFLIAGNLVKDVSVKEFDVCLEVTRDSIIAVLAVFKLNSSLSFDFLVDMVS
jgi:hypothetical protein